MKVFTYVTRTTENEEDIDEENSEKMNLINQGVKYMQRKRNRDFNKTSEIMIE